MSSPFIIRRASCLQCSLAWLVTRSMKSDMALCTILATSLGTPASAGRTVRIVLMMLTRGMRCSSSQVCSCPLSGNPVCWMPVFLRKGARAWGLLEGAFMAGSARITGLIDGSL